MPRWKICEVDSILVMMLARNLEVSGLIQILAVFFADMRVRMIASVMAMTMSHMKMGLRFNRSQIA